MRSLLTCWLAAGTVAAFLIAPWWATAGQPPGESQGSADSKVPTDPTAIKPAATIGKKLDGFSLRDYHGKVYSLGDFAAKKALVIAFVGVDCPLATLYAPRLVQLAEEFAPQGVAFLAIDANRQDSATELAAYARTHGIAFPVLKDAGNAVADLVGALRTPEVFVLDREQIVRYRGRIDDQYGVGFRRPRAVRRDLATALEQLLSGKPVSEPVTEPAGCLIGRVPKKEPHGSVTYTNQIARLLNARCVTCHRSGEIAPFPLTAYEEVAGWADTIREVVREGRMPPWFADSAHGTFANDARLSREDKRLIDAWVADGSPEGDRAQLPPVPEFAEGWAIPRPDQVICMDEQPANVAAEGTLPYRYLITDPHFKEDKWIQAIEARPGNRGVVHHIIVSFVRPGERPNLGLGGGPLVGYAPGMPPVVYPPGTAQLVPKGSKVVFQIHYTPNGSPQQDRSCVGLVFADPSSVKQRVWGGATADKKFRIPAGADDYVVQSSRTLGEDVRLLTLTPHMHMRGKAFRFEAEYPDGRRETLLDVPRYDFNWQLRYDLANPKLLPRGTRLLCTARYDNSENNPNNPNPRRAVGWGEQTWDEMMIGYYTTVPAASPGGAAN